MPIESEQQEGNTYHLQCLPGSHLLLASVLLSVVFFSILSVVSASTFTAGDLAPRGNPDGLLDAGDLLILQQFVLGTQTPVGNEDLVADVAPLGLPDGQLNAGDIVLLMRAITGHITLPPVVIGPDSPLLDAVSSPTNNNPQTVTGTAVPNTEVRLYVNSVQQDTVLSDAGGLFSFQAILFDGINSVHATTWDGVDESAASNVLSIDYVNTIPRSQGGTITQDTVWTPGSPNDPYVINANFTIANGASLILLPGAEVQFPADYTFQVDGELIVLGSAASPVVFTSSRASPAANNWQGIFVSSTATRVVIEYAEISYADRGIEFAANALTDSGACDAFCVRNSLIENNRYGLYLTGASPWIEANIIQNSTYDGIWLVTSSPEIRDNTLQNNGSSYAGIRVGNASHPTVTGNVITGQRYGVYIYPTSRSAANNPAPVINNNGLYGNSSYDLYAYNYFDAPNITLDATGNWWGTTSPAEIAANIIDQQENATYGPVVDFRDYLDGFPGSPVVVNTLLGEFSTNTTLFAGTTYEVLGNITVPSGVTLTIEAGVTLNFNGGTNSLLQVDGALVVQGTMVDPVVFTSGQAVPAANDWQGIYVSSTATQAEFDYVEVRYAERGIEFAANALTDNTASCVTFCVRNSVIENNRYGLYLTGASPWIEANTVQNNIYDGLWLATSSPEIRDNTLQNNGSSYAGIRVGNASHPTVTGNVITGQRYGFVIYPANRSAVNNPAPVINGNAIFGNSTDDLYASNYFDAANITLDATGNWWGTTSPAEIAANIYDQQESATYGPVVDFRDYLDGFPGNPVVVNTLLGEFGTNTTLVSGTTYEVLGNITVPSGVTLTIEAGVTLKFDGGTNSLLQVDGALVVQGTAGSPVVFTSGQAVPAANDWQGIYVSSTATQAEFDYVEVRYAERGIEFAANALTDNTASCVTFCVRNSVIENNRYGLYLTGASPWIEANTVQNNIYDGIWLVTSSPEIRDNILQNNGSNYAGIRVGNASHPTVTGNVITGQRYGLVIYPANRSAVNNPAPVINNNGLYGNSSYDLYAYNYFDAVSITLAATGNWWGTTSPAEIAANIYDQQENVTYSPVVDFRDYLDGFPGSPVVVNTLLGEFSTNTTLVAGTTYEVLGNITVPSGVTLTIEAGVTLNFNGGTNSLLQVDGALVVQGTMVDPVVFTSGQAVPAANDWQGIYVSSTATQAEFDYVEVRYAERGIEFAANPLTDNTASCVTFCVRNSVIENNRYGLYLTGASPWIEANTVQNNIYDGIWLATSSPEIRDNILQNNGSSYAGIRVGNASHPTVMGNVITGQRYGLYVRPANRSAVNNPVPVINNNSLYGNSSYDLYAYNYFDASNITLDATGNWWGTTSPAEIAANIYDQQDNATYGPVVDFRNYLDGFPGSPVVVNTLLGEFGTNTTLVAGTTYEVLGNITVPSGVTLTIEAGVTLNFNGGTNSLLQVDGALVVQGTAGSPVVFTSGQAVPAANDWQGIYVSSTATQAEFDYVEVRYAERGIEFAANALTDNTASCVTFCVRNSVIENNRYGLYLTGASPWIEANTVQNNIYDGIWLATSSPEIRDNTLQNNGSNYAGIRVGNASHPTVTGNVITGQRYGLYIYPANRSAANNPAPVINNNGLYGNSSFDLYAYNYFDAANITLDATGNWWGTTYRTTIQQNMYDSFDNASYGPVVDFSGYLDDMNGSPVPVVLLQGDLTADLTLLNGTIYEVLGTLRITAGVTLTVSQGAILRFDGAANTLLNEGTLLIQGTENNPAILTSGQETPAVGDWGGIVSAATASVTVIQYAEISYANYGVSFAPGSGMTGTDACDTLCVKNSLLEINNTGLFIDGSDPWIERNVIQYNLDDGIYINNASPGIRTNTIRVNGNNGGDDAGIDIRGTSSPSITDGNQISGNSRYGIHVYGSQTSGGDPAPVITGNGIYDNTNYDFYAYNFFDAANVMLNVTGNWWNTTDSAVIATRVYDNTDNASLAPVADTSNFVTAPVTLGLVLLQNVTQNLTTIRPYDGDTLDINFDLAAVQANVVLKILTETDRQLVYESTPQLLTAGSQVLNWDGRDNASNYVADEAYVYEVIAVFDSRYDESASTGGGTVRVPNSSNDTTYNAYINDFYKTSFTLSANARAAFSVTPPGGQRFYTMDYVPFEAGTHPIVWDGRDQYGNILSGSVGVWIHDTIDLPTNVVIVKGNNPAISGTAPDVEVKSNPYRMMHSYDQVSRMIYNISMDCTVTVKLLPPGVTDINSGAALTLVDNELQSANDGGGQPLDHEIEWRGYDVADTNDILVSDEGTYTFVIQATSSQSGITTVYRGALQLYN